MMIEKTHFAHAFFTLNQERYVFRFAFETSVKLQIKPQAVLLMGDPSPPLSTQVDVDTDVIRVIKWTMHVTALCVCIQNLHLRQSHAWSL